MNPYSKLQEQIEMAAEIATNEPICYFMADRGADWLLIIAQGIERTQEFCLASEGNLFQYTHRDPK